MSGHSPLTMKFAIPTSSVEVLSKCVDQHTLEKYIVKPSDRVSFPLPYMDPAIIDLQLLLESQDELKKFESLLSSWGVVQLVNHGIENSTLDQVLQVTKAFFDLPIEEKEKYARSNDEEWNFSLMQGWGNDRMSVGQPFNWLDRLMLLLHPSNQRILKLWPDESLPKFREIVDDYVKGMIKIRDTFVKAISKSLNLADDNLIWQYTNESSIVTRFNYFPTSPYPDRILGTLPHTDSNLLTIVLVDKEVEGFHIEKDDQWYVVPIVPNAIIVNISDMVEIMTNGRVKSPIHRIVTNATRGRISIASGIAPPPSSKIGPLKELIDEEHPKLYPTLENSSKVTADYYANGKIFIKEIRKYGPNIVHQEGESLKKEI
ncbi:hypothetical protein vseg_020899 [Gypsophila vaccaria]